MRRDNRFLAGGTAAIERERLDSTVLTLRSLVWYGA
jgi:hypothetical protein